MVKYEVLSKMEKQEALKKIEEALEKMGCTDLSTLEENSSENYFTVIFNCKLLTSFVAELPGWVYSGIQIDPLRKRQYKIDFRKISLS